jgi:hypothetical protein
MTLDIPCEYERPDWRSNKAKSDAHLEFVSERIKIGKVTKKMSSMSLAPAKSPAIAQSQLHEAQAQDSQAQTTESFRKTTYRYDGMPSDHDAALSSMLDYPFDNSVVASRFDMANGFAYSNDTTLDVATPCATLRSSESIDEPTYIYNTNASDNTNTNSTTRPEESLLDHISATSCVTSPEEKHAEGLNSDVPSQFYAGDAESFRGDLLWQEAFDLPYR